jgi:hypothetical protein
VLNAVTVELAIAAMVANVQRFEIDNDADVQQHAALESDRPVGANMMHNPSRHLKQPISMD